MKTLEELLSKLPAYVIKDGVLLFLYIYKDDSNSWRIVYEQWGRSVGFVIDKRPTLLEAVEDTLSYLEEHIEIKQGKFREKRSN